MAFQFTSCRQDSVWEVISSLKPAVMSIPMSLSGTSTTYKTFKARLFCCSSYHVSIKLSNIKRMKEKFLRSEFSLKIIVWHGLVRFDNPNFVFAVVHHCNRFMFLVASLCLCHRSFDHYDQYTECTPPSHFSLLWLRNDFFVHFLTVSFAEKAYFSRPFLYDINSSYCLVPYSQRW
jgi:hypothetical protein